MPSLATIILIALMPHTISGQCTRGEIQLDTTPPTPYTGRRVAPSNLLSGVQIWPNGTIPFTIDGDFTEREKTALREAISAIHENTCVRFVPNNGCQRRDALQVTNDHKFTFDNGYQGRPQETGQSWDNLRALSQSTHGLFHVLGFQHEEQRRDAKQHLAGPFWNCGVGRPNNNVMLNSLDDFDYNTVMCRLNYGRRQCSSAVRAKDEPIQDNTNRILGDKVGPSVLDYRKINLAYGCGDFL